MRLTKFNPETGLYEYVEKAKTLDEYRAQRKAAIQKLGEYEDKASEVAEEILEEIWENADLLYDGYRDIVVITEKDFAELKKKYTEGGENGTDGISS